MKRLISIIMILSLCAALLLPAGAVEPQGKTTEFIFIQDDVTYMATITEYENGSYTTTVSGNDGYFEVVEATRIDDNTVLIESNGEKQEYNLTSINNVKSTMRTTYTRQGTIVYNIPFGLSTQPYIFFI